MWTVEGEGFSQMTISLHKPHLIKVSSNGEGGGVKNNPKICLCRLWMSPDGDPVRHGWLILGATKTIWTQ